MIALKLFCDVGAKKQSLPGRTCEHVPAANDRPTARRRAAGIAGWRLFRAEIAKPANPANPWSRHLRKIAQDAGRFPPMPFDIRNDTRESEANRASTIRQRQLCPRTAIEGRRASGDDGSCNEHQGRAMLNRECVAPGKARRGCNRRYAEKRVRAQQPAYGPPREQRCHGAGR